MWLASQATGRQRNDHLPAGAPVRGSRLGLALRAGDLPADLAEYREGIARVVVGQCDGHVALVGEHVQARDGSLRAAAVTDDAGAVVAGVLKPVPVSFAGECRDLALHHQPGRAGAEQPVAEQRLRESVHVADGREAPASWHPLIENLVDGVARRGGMRARRTSQACWAIPGASAGWAALGCWDGGAAPALAWAGAARGGCGGSSSAGGGCHRGDAGRPMGDLSIELVEAGVCHARGLEDVLVDVV